MCRSTEKSFVMSFRIRRVEFGSLPERSVGHAKELWEQGRRVMEARLQHRAGPVPQASAFTRGRVVVSDFPPGPGKPVQSTGKNPAVGGTPEKPTGHRHPTRDELNALRAPAEATPQAVGSAAPAQPRPGGSEPAQVPAAAPSALGALDGSVSLPDATILIDRHAYEQMQATARAATEKMEATVRAVDEDRRERIIRAAIHEGKMTPAQAHDWRKLIAADEELVTRVITNIKPQSAMPTVEIGYGYDPDEMDPDMADYHKYFPRG